MRQQRPARGMSGFPARVAETARGRSLVADRDLPAGAIVARFEGPLVPFAEVPEDELRYALWFDGDRWMIPKSAARYLDHGCEPNCVLRDRPGDPDRCDAVTVRPVSAGEVLTFAYNHVDAEEWFAHLGEPAYSFWHPAWSFDCLCGSQRCQGRISGYLVTGDIEAARRRHGPPRLR
jgi:hypothetical protein